MVCSGITSPRRQREIRSHPISRWQQQGTQSAPKWQFPIFALEQCEAHRDRVRALKPEPSAEGKHGLTLESRLPLLINTSKLQCQVALLAVHTRYASLSGALEG